jgi:LuxR family maltose regulon positive regulatory protein
MRFSQPAERETRLKTHVAARHPRTLACAGEERERSLVSVPAVDALLTTKLYMPPPRRELVARPRLTARLDVGLRDALTLIMAPAGFGKSTLVREWHVLPEHANTPLAWLALDDGDNDLARFARYLVAALQTVLPGVGQRTLAMLQAPPLPPNDTLLTPLVNELAALSEDLVVVLDDFHVLDAPELHQAVTYLLDHLPPRVHLLVTSRSEPPLPLARLRARGQLVELRATDLCFTAEEVGVFLTGVMELELTSGDVAALGARTEGWIAGLQLAALSLRSIQAEARATHAEPIEMARFIAKFTGSHRYIVDYLAEEVLSRQPLAILQFLLHTSILERMCAELCAAVTAHQDSQVLLEYVERADLFVIPLDDDRRWYRYHRLFADVLRRQLGQTEPDLLPELHQRASAWYQGHGLVSEATHHALAAADFASAADLIEAHAEEIGLRNGEIRTLLGWFAALPTSVMLARPLLCLQHAAMHLLLGQCDGARQAAARAQVGIAVRLSHELTPPEGEGQLAAEIVADALLTDAHDARIPSDLRRMLGQLASLQAILALYRGDLPLVEQLSQRALGLVPETDLIWHARARLNAIWAHRINGDLTLDAERLLKAVVQEERASGHMYFPELATINLGCLYALQGRLHRAAAAYDEALRVLEGGTTHTIVEMYGQFGLGEIHYEWNDLHVAERLLATGVSALRDMQGANAELATVGYLALARLQQARGRHAAALATLGDFTELARQRAYAPELLERVAATRAQVELAQGEVASAVRWAVEVRDLPLDDTSWAFRREPVYLMWARVHIAQLSQDTSELGGHVDHDDHVEPLRRRVNAVLDRVLWDAETHGRLRSALEALILRALALRALRDPARAQRTIARALALAEPEGYVRLFLDEGPPMLALLREAQAREKPPAYVAPLLAAAGTTSTYEAALPGGGTRGRAARERLSERELEILELLADGLSTAEMAAELVIAPGTVKNHLKHIFGKLGAHSRLQAVERARALRLL